MLPLKTKENFKQICQCKHFPASESKRQRRRLTQASSMFTHTSSYHRNRFHCYRNTFHIESCIYNNTNVCSGCLLYNVHIIQIQIRRHTHRLAHPVTQRWNFFLFLIVAQFSVDDFCSFVLAFVSEHYRRVPFENGWHLFETEWKWFLCCSLVWMAFLACHKSYSMQKFFRCCCYCCCC